MFSNTDKHEEDAEIQELRLQIEYEKQRSKVLYENYAEWKLTNTQLEVNMDNINEEENEWKTRYETQLTQSKSMEEELQNLRQKIKAAKNQLKSLTRVDKDHPEKLPPVDLPKLIVNLTREKYNLESQLRDYEWRLDQEAKSYHKVDEKRKMILGDISKSKNTVVDRQEELSNDALQKSLRGLERDHKNRAAKQRRPPSRPGSVSSRRNAAGGKRKNAHKRALEKLKLQDQERMDAHESKEQFGYDKLPDIHERF